MVAMRLKMDMTAWYFGLLFASSGWLHRGNAFCPPMPMIATTHHMKLKVSSSLSVMHQPSTTTIWNEQRYLHRRRGIATSIDSSASSSDDSSYMYVCVWSIHIRHTYKAHIQGTHLRHTYHA